MANEPQKSASIGEVLRQRKKSTYSRDSHFEGNSHSQVVMALFKQSADLSLEYIFKRSGLWPPEEGTRHARAKSKEAKCEKKTHEHESCMSI